MSLPDTAEYWQDVKSHFNNKRSPFVHIKGFDCGHFHVIEAEKLFQVDCRACIKHINSNAELIDLRAQQRIEDSEKRTEKVKLKWKKKYPNNPDCPTCGFVMVERTNKTTGDKFFGCCQYPNCKTVCAK